MTSAAPAPPTTTRSHPRWATLVVFLAALAAILPTLGDFGLTYDEPAYRFSQMLSGQWWERLVRARSAAELSDLFAADSLLYYWPYARHGINFHPPLAGQLNLLSWELTGRWLAEIPARRLATAVEYAAAIAVLFAFLARRYGGTVGVTAAAALLTMPRVYGQAHLIDTDTPGMVLWLLAAVAFWKGLHEPSARRWRIAVGVLAGLGFVQKLGAVFVLAPLFAWLALGHLPRALRDRTDRRAWVDALLTSAALLLPLALIYAEIRRLVRLLPPPQYANLFFHDPPSLLPGVVLLLPLAVWLVRRGLARWRPRSRIWGVERPALEIWYAVLAFGPAVAWLGNPAWWRHSLSRLAHYYQLTTARRGTLPDIQILYFGRVYEYDLPWHSGWVLIGITVPVTLLVAALVGLAWGLARLRSRDRLPLFFLLLFATPPAMRLLPAPAHDGVRLILACFPFLAAMAGWGAGALAAALARLLPVRRFWIRALVSASVVLPAAWELVRIHPYELSYFNQIIGGARGAWESGFELSYWYDAFTPQVMRDLNRKLPRGAALSYANELSNPQMIPLDQQALGILRGDIRFGNPAEDRELPFMMVLTHDSKASSFDRLLFAMEPWYASKPPQLDRLRVLAVFDPLAVSRAWALQLLAHGPAAEPVERPPAAPAFVRRWLPPLARLWGDGLTLVERPSVRPEVFEWAEDDPEGLRAAARWLADRKAPSGHPGAARLHRILSRDDDLAAGKDYSGLLLSVRPEAVHDAALILIAHGGAVRRVLEHPAYLDPETVGGTLDRDLHH